MQNKKTVKEFLKILTECSKDDYEALCYDGLSKEQQLNAKSDSFYSGKVREMIECKDHLYMHHTDRLSAFDKFVSLAPLKGVLLNSINAYWLEHTKQTVPNHFIKAVDERTLKIEKKEPFKVEVVVRGYMAGSLKAKYLAGQREVCGQKLPDNIRSFEAFTKPILTPTTKAEVYEHDEDISPRKLIENNVCTDEEWQQISAYALSLFKKGQQRFSQIGWILADTKYEFGKTPSGSVCLIDEIHTPDSSRLWMQDSYLENLKIQKEPEMFDKQIIRDYLQDKGFKGSGDLPVIPREIILKMLVRYNEIAENLTGSPIKTRGIYSEIRALTC